jgi:hypothetical protein
MVHLLPFLFQPEALGIRGKTYGFAVWRECDMADQSSLMIPDEDGHIFPGR